MSTIDDIWASMNEGSVPSKAIVPKETKKAATEGKSSKEKKGKVKDKEIPQKGKGKENKCAGEPEKKTKKNALTTKTPVMLLPKPAISCDEMRGKIMRDINSSGDSDVSLRRSGLTKLKKTLFEDITMSPADYNELFHDICKPIFKRFADTAEKCRELSLRITGLFIEQCTDLVPVLGYFFPAFIQRMPAGYGYDEDMKIFVTDMEMHEAYRRGRAVERQDKYGHIAGTAKPSSSYDQPTAVASGDAAYTAHTVVEPSEEIRLLACQTLLTLINRVNFLGSTPILHPYFQETIMFLQAQLNDPYPDLKYTACQAIETLARSTDFEAGTKFFSVALVRALLPVLRHRHARVRAAALTALHFVMIVPDRAKQKAAGSDAIADIAGFREENVLQIAAFYKPDIQINYLAELAQDKSSLVREKLVALLTSLLTEIGDRYDHQTRLLPYLLDLLTDDTETVAQAAWQCLQLCGKQYEEEHQNEIIERRQYGVDGDKRINLDKPLPAPFKERPRIGIRLYVRGNTKRFLSAMIRELTNWVGQTRLKSARLLKVILVLCEEHLTMEAHKLFPDFIKALKFAREDGDSDLHTALCEAYELLGRYMLPEISVHYVLPRLRGDPDVVQFGVDSEMRITVMEMLKSLLEGAKPSQLPPLFNELVTTLTDPFVISPESPSLQSAALDVLNTVFRSLKGKGNAVIESHFVATGRISSMKSTMRVALKFLLTNLSHPSAELASKSAEGLRLLAEQPSDASTTAVGAIAGARAASASNGSSITFTTSTTTAKARTVETTATTAPTTTAAATSTAQAQAQLHRVMALVAEHGVELLKAVLDDYEIDSSWVVVSGPGNGNGIMVGGQILPCSASFSSSSSISGSALPGATPEHNLLCRLIENATNAIQSDVPSEPYSSSFLSDNGKQRTEGAEGRDAEAPIWSDAVKKHGALCTILFFLCYQVKNLARTDVGTEIENDALFALSELLLSALAPIYSSLLPIQRPHVYKPLLSAMQIPRFGGSMPAGNETSPSSSLLLFEISTASTSFSSSSSSPSIDAKRNDEFILCKHGLMTTHGVRIAQQAAAVVTASQHALLQEILRAFVLDPRWTRSAKLQSQRLKVLQLLLSGDCYCFYSGSGDGIVSLLPSKKDSDHDEVAAASGRDNGSKSPVFTAPSPVFAHTSSSNISSRSDRYSASLLFSSTTTAGEVTNNRVGKRDNEDNDDIDDEYVLLSSELLMIRPSLVDYAPAIFQSILPSGSAPTSPEYLRASVISILSQMIRSISALAAEAVLRMEESNNNGRGRKGSSIAQTGSGALRNFSFWAAAIALDEKDCGTAGATGTTSTVGTLKHFVLKSKLAIQIALRFLLRQAMFDSSDSVRRAALRVLLLSAGYCDASAGITRGGWVLMPLLLSSSSGDDMSVLDSLSSIVPSDFSIPIKNAINSAAGGSGGGISGGGSNHTASSSSSLSSLLWYEDVVSTLLSQLSIAVARSSSPSFFYSAASSAATTVSGREVDVIEGEEEAEEDIRDSYLTALDGALRTLAVLEPAVFERLVREEIAKSLSPVLGKNSGGGGGCGGEGGKAVQEMEHERGRKRKEKEQEELRSVLSGLVDHADILLQFSK